MSIMEVRHAFAGLVAAPYIRLDFVIVAVSQSNGIVIDAGLYVM
ncbi:MAG: hypothetical protein ACRD8Z_19155 [Nitrososphaeraceae archaeon]